MNEEKERETKKSLVNDTKKHKKLLSFQVKISSCLTCHCHKLMKRVTKCENEFSRNKIMKNFHG